jgi:hypothetical protein
MNASEQADSIAVTGLWIARNRDQAAVAFEAIAMCLQTLGRAPTVARIDVKAAIPVNSTIHPFANPRTGIISR